MMDVHKQHIDLLGYRGKDKVTGFYGVIDSVSFDLFGCVQLSLKPPMDKDGEMPAGFWFDAPRIEVDYTERVMDPPDFYAGYVAEGKKGATPKPDRKG